MERTARFHLTQYRMAEKHAVTGDWIRCLQICWELRLDPSLGLYRRAMVNLLLATTADIRKYPHKAKYAQECITLIAQVRREFGPKDPNGTLAGAEKHAREALDNITLELQELKAWKKDLNTPDEVEVEWENLVKVNEGKPIVARPIEGAFTDMAIGHGRPKKAEAEKVAAQPGDANLGTSMQQEGGLDKH